jgi:zinc D-Ala-D-Ala carboxypeptidase
VGLKGVAKFLIVAGVAFGLLAPRPAAAYQFSGNLRPGDRGRDVKALQVRIAGWYPKADRTLFRIDGIFGDATALAVRRFKRHYGIPVSNSAGGRVYRKLARLEDANRSTRHFDYSEFTQNRNPRCSRKANWFAETFRGGPISARAVKRNVTRLMWRLEALRAKGGDHAIGVNSGFRSIPYNRCISGARKSQHLYGTAADLRMANTGNRVVRNMAKASQVHGIGCYAHQSHNHLDLRIHNRHVEETREWWWPKRDSFGRDLDEADRPCWGEVKRTESTSVSGASLGPTVGVFTYGLDDAVLPSEQDLARFAEAGEPPDLQGLD